MPNQPYDPTMWGLPSDWKPTPDQPQPWDMTPDQIAKQQQDIAWTVAHTTPGYSAGGIPMPGGGFSRIGEVKDRTPLNPHGYWQNSGSQAIGIRWVPDPGYDPSGNPLPPGWDVPMPGGPPQRAITNPVTTAPVTSPGAGAAGGGNIALPGGSTWNESVWNAGGPMSSGLEYWYTHPEFQKAAASYAAGTGGGGTMLSGGAISGAIPGKPISQEDMAKWLTSKGWQQGATPTGGDYQTTTSFGKNWYMPMNQWMNQSGYKDLPIWGPDRNQTVAQLTPPAATSPATTPTPITPPNLSGMSTTPLVTPPTASAGQNALTSLQMLLGRGATGGLGTYKFPDLVKQTQQRWGGFSPAAFSKP